ncbi:MAG: NADH-quinone oxidoreductase subunit D [Candidatus Omnitrophica bacterium]|nr:NADH-quinone oxidoreductase subunit D [Candidatus Omnitrophota bacterium]
MMEYEELIINMGPQHPSTHGVLYLELKLDGEVVLDCRPNIGYLHRSIEKIAENRSFVQFMPFTDRLDYLASMNNNLGLCLTVEKLMNIAVSPRAQYLRVIIAELNRIASHLFAVSTFAQDLGAFATPLFYALRDREKIIQIFDHICGQRLTYNYMRVGGVSGDLPAGVDALIKEYIPYQRKMLDEFETLLTGNVIFCARSKNIGVLSKETAIKYGVTGPNLRASGYKWDLRKDEPYLVYDKFDFDIPTGENGDSWDRYIVRIREIRESLKIIEQALGGLPEGDPVAKVNKVFRPNGETYMCTENPRGELGFYIVGDGNIFPYRLKIRAPSFSNLSVLSAMVKGLNISDTVCALGSLDIVMGEIDR